MAVLHVTPAHAMPAAPVERASRGPDRAEDDPLGWLARLCAPVAAGSAGAWFSGEPEPPAPEEAAGMGRAVPRRQREFAAGRQCARAALAQLGIRDFPVRVGLDRAPIWPPGVLGSITHTHVAGDWLFAASVALARTPRTEDSIGPGLDAEPAEPLPRDVLEAVLSAPERASLSVLAGRAPAVLARVMFSAKEAVYKALYPLRREVLGFSDVAIELTPDAGGTRGTFRFRRTARSRTHRGPHAESWHAEVGRYCIAQGLVLTLVLPGTASSPAMGASAMC